MVLFDKTIGEFWVIYKGKNMDIRKLPHATTINRESPKRSFRIHNLDTTSIVWWNGRVKARPIISVKGEHMFTVKKGSELKMLPRYDHYIDGYISKSDMVLKRAYRILTVTDMRHVGYATAQSEDKRCPILLFNRAGALVHKIEEEEGTYGVSAELLYRDAKGNVVFLEAHPKIWPERRLDWYEVRLDGKGDDIWITKVYEL